MLPGIIESGVDPEYIAGEASQARLLGDFPFGTLSRGFIVFHETGGKRPTPFARLEGPTHQAHRTVSDNDPPGGGDGVVVVDIPAHRATSTGVMPFLMIL